MLVLAIASGAAWWVGSNTQSPDQAAARAAEPEPSWITAPVEFRVLSSTLITRGDVRPEQRIDIGSPTSVEGDPVVTQTVVAPGEQVNDGDRVVEVSGRPVFVVQGDAPIYRTLGPGMSGDDVTALQEALIRLGYPVPAEELKTFGEATKTAVTAFYAHSGYTPVSTSDTYAADIAAAERAVTEAEAIVGSAQAAVDNAAAGPPGSEIATADEAVASAGRALEVANANVITDVQLAQSAVDIAIASRTEIEKNPEGTVDEWNASNLAVSTADVALSDVLRDTADAAEAAQAALDIAVQARQELDAPSTDASLDSGLDAAVQSRNDAVAALATLVAVNGPTVPQGEIQFMPATKARVLTTGETEDTGKTEDTGSEAALGSATYVSLAGGALEVIGSVNPSDVELVATGQDVEILDETTNQKYTATVRTVAESATTGFDGLPGYVVTIAPTNPLPDGLVGANVRITMTAATTRTEQLVVPLAAISSAADGSTRVSVLDPATGEPIDIIVQDGLSAGGFVAIEPIEPQSLSTEHRVVVGR